MARQIYDTATLLGTLRDRPEKEVPLMYWYNLLTGGRTLTFTDEWVDFGKIPNTGRKLAPFVAPLAQGRPIYTEGATVARFKPAYIKPKDAINPARVIVRRGSEVLSPTPMSPGERRNAIAADIMLAHEYAIRRRWDWLAARAVQDGKVVIEGEDSPARLVDFQRDAGNIITLAPGARWGDAGINVLDSIQSMVDVVYAAKFSGAVNRLTVGTAAWAKMRKDTSIEEALDTTYRGNDAVTLDRGVSQGGEVRRVGTIGAGIEVYVYSDYYEEAGAQVPFMDPRDVVLTGPNLNGYACFGAIQDAHSNFQALPIFPRMWIENDPPVEFIMNQSAPLMVPVNPNNSLRARVVA